MNVKYGRKTSIAAAVAGVLAAAPVAIAQADVSIYGIADVAVASLDYEQNGSKLFLNSDSGSGGSRLGFNASQDLGGGLTAKANYEAGVAMDNPGTALFGTRQAWVGLSGGFGSLTLGEDYSLSFLAAFRGEYCGWCGIASPANLTRQGVRTANYLKYNSPDFSGFSFGLAHTFGEDTTSGDDLNDANEVAAFYSAGPVNVAFSNRVSAVAANNDLTDRYLGANVTFGMFKIFALLGSAENDTATVDETYSNLGLTIKLGDGDLNFQYALTDGDAAETSTTLAAVSYFHSIGKGTTVYAQYASVDNDANVSRSSWPGSGATFAGGNGVDPTGIQVGLKYAF